MDSNTSLNVDVDPVESPDFDPLANIRHLEANLAGISLAGNTRFRCLST